MKDKLPLINGIIITLAISQIPLSLILPTYYELILFGIVASIIISAIIYVHRLPNAVSSNEQQSSREVES